VNRALVYLDNLAEEAADNTSLQMELGAAYLKIGDVQGLPYSANLGDTAGALTSYRKALGIVERVVAREPSNAAALALLADAYDRAGFVQERALRWPLAVREHRSALAIRKRLPHSVKGELATARTLVAIGDCMHMGRNVVPSPTAPHGWYAQALQVLARIPDSAAHRTDRLREVARANQRLGGVYTHPPRDLPRALAYHAAALRALEECMRLAPDDAVARRNFADQLVMTATAQNAMRDAAGALTGIDRALPILTALAAADANNREAQHDLAFAYEQKSLALIVLERWDEANFAAAKVRDIREHLIAADATNREDRRDISRTYGVLAQIETARGNARQAAELLAAQRAIQREMAR
jgi:tetratricopeptide (TPR) repeat protein